MLQNAADEEILAALSAGVVDRVVVVFVVKMLDRQLRFRLDVQAAAAVVQMQIGAILLAAVVSRQVEAVQGIFRQREHGVQIRRTAHVAGVVHEHASASAYSSRKSCAEKRGASS